MASTKYTQHYSRPLLIGSCFFRAQVCLEHHSHHDASFEHDDDPLTPPTTSPASPTPSPCPSPPARPPRWCVAPVVRPCQLCAAPPPPSREPAKELPPPMPQHRTPNSNHLSTAARATSLTRPTSHPSRATETMAARRATRCSNISWSALSEVSQLLEPRTLCKVSEADAARGRSMAYLAATADDLDLQTSW